LRRNPLPPMRLAKLHTCETIVTLLVVASVCDAQKWPRVVSVGPAVSCRECVVRLEPAIRLRAPASLPPVGMGSRVVRLSDGRYAATGGGIAQSSVMLFDTA